MRTRMCDVKPKKMSLCSLNTHGRVYDPDDSDGPDDPDQSGSEDGLNDSIEVTVRKPYDSTKALFTGKSGRQKCLASTESDQPHSKHVH